MNQQDFPAPSEGFVVTHTLIVEDIDASVDFYVNKLGASEIMRIPDGPAILGFANTWIIINVGGGPTEDKPTVYLAPPSDPDRIDSFMNVRVADIQSIYEEGSGTRFSLQSHSARPSTCTRTGSLEVILQRLATCTS